MKRLFVAVAWLALLPQAALASGSALPSEVTVLISRIVECNHWLGEEPYDAERKSDIEKAISVFGCENIDQDVAASSTKHKDNAPALRAITEATERTW